MKSLIRATSVVVLMVTVGFAQAQPFETFERGVRVRAEFNKTELAVGEPLVLTINVTNVSAPHPLGTMDYRGHFSEGNDINLQIQEPGELPYRYEADEDQILFGSTDLNLEIGMKAHQEYLILYDQKKPNGYVFGKPGDYAVSLKLTYSVMREPERLSVVIPPTKITVREPRGREAEAFNLINNNACAKALQRLTAAVDQKTYERIAKVGSDYSDTVYGPSCAYAATLWPQLKTPPDMNAAASASRMFIEKFPRNFRTANVIVNLIASYHYIGSRDMALEWFYYLRFFDPGHQMFRAKNDVAQAIYFDAQKEAESRRWWLYEKPWHYKPNQAPDQSSR